MEAFRYGMMRQRLLGMEAVLPDGSILADLARVPKNNEGYDLRQIFCGAEGTLGVVTRVTMRLERMDPPARTVMIGCDTAEAALRVMRALEDTAGLLLAEIMWRNFARMVADATGLSGTLGFCDAPVYAIYSVACAEDIVVGALEPLLEEGTIIDAVLAQSEREAADIWRIREDSFACVHKIPHALWFDVSLPLSQLDGYVETLDTRVRNLCPDALFQAMGHMADGNLHLTVGRATPFEAPLAEAVALAVEDGVKAAGGSISAEHGIGTAKLATLARNVSPAKIIAMRRMKTAFDPHGIMNPGKVIPPEL
jgi:FAD/FMN-containing dehydrogenase